MCMISTTEETIAAKNLVVTLRFPEAQNQHIARTSRSKKKGGLEAEKNATARQSGRE